MRRRLAEADAGIDDQSLARDSGRLASGDARFQIIEYVERNIAVSRRFLHALG